MKQQDENNADPNLKNTSGAELTLNEHKALLKSARAILKYEDFATAARKLFDQCKDVTGATSGYIALLNSDGSENEVLFLDSGGRPCSVDESLPMPIRGLREQAYRLRLGVYDNNFAESAWMDFMPEGHVRLDNVLFAPLVIDNEAVGLIGLANKEGGFSRRDLNFTSAMSDIAALALRNSRTMESLKESEEKYRLLTENTSDVIWVLNINQRRFTYISPSIIQLRGYTPEEAMAQSLEESLTPESQERVNKDLGTYLPRFLENPKMEQEYITEVRQPCKDGKLVWVEVSIKLRFNEDHEIEAVGVSRNIDQRKEFEKELLFLSLHDQLTGLYNRHYFVNELNRLQNSREYPIAIISADLDGLKLINDSLGHAEGDRYLKSCADLLKSSLREPDILARVGGDEFALVLPKTDLEAGNELIERIYNRFDEYNRQNSKGKAALPLYLSLGLAVSELKVKPLEEIYQAADRFMYQDKIKRRDAAHKKISAATARIQDRVG